MPLLTSGNLTTWSLRSTQKRQSPVISKLIFTDLQVKLFQQALKLSTSISKTTFSEH